MVLSIVWWGGGAAAQAPLEFVPIGDLLERSHVREPYLAPVLLPGRRLMLGEQEWLGGDYDYDSDGPPLRRDVPAWFGGDQLIDLLGRLFEQQSEFGLLAQQDVVAVDARLAAPVRATLAELRQRLPPVVQVDIELRAVRAGGATVLLRRVLHCPSGRRSWVSDLQRTTALLGYEVEIAQGSQMARPTVRPIEHGAMVVVRPFVSPVDSTVWLELMARVAEAGGGGDAPAPATIETGHPGFGAMDRGVRTVSELAGVVPARLGESVTQAWDGAGGVRFELRLTPTWQVAAPVRPGGHELEYLPDWSRFAGYRSVASMPFDPVDLSDESDEQQFAGVLERAGVMAVDTGDGAGVVGLDGVADSLRAMTAARYAAAPPVAMQVTLYDCEAGAAFGDDGAAPAQARRLGGAELRTVLGSWACATVHEDLSVLRGWEVEVAQSARIPRPVCRRLPTGLFVNARCRGDAVELDCELSWRSAIRGREMALNVAVGLPAAVRAQQSGNHVQTSETPAMVLPQDTVRIEQVDVHVIPARATLPLRAARAAVLRQAGMGLGPDRELVVVVRRLGD
ncbi:MAG: hypothetical protein AB7O84_14120 [Planctomycetota bacterium]